MGSEMCIRDRSIACVHIHAWVSCASNNSNHHAANVCGSVSNAYSWYDTHIASVAVRELEQGTHWALKLVKLELHYGGPTSLGTADSTAPNIHSIQNSKGRWGYDGASNGYLTADGSIVVRHGGAVSVGTTTHPSATAVSMRVATLGQRWGGAVAGARSDVALLDLPG